MRKTLKTVGIYLVISLIVLFLLPIVCSNILVTIFNAIFGPDNGIIAANVFLHICFPIISAGVIFVIKFRNSEDKRNYLNSMEGMEYDFKIDLSKTIRDKYFYVECIVFAVIFILVALIGDPSIIMYILASALFFGLNLLLSCGFHKKWCEQRLRK